MSILAPIGRVLFSLIFIFSLPTLFSHDAVARAAAAGVPYAQYAVPIGGILAFLGGIMVALGLYARLGAFFILLFLVPTTFFMHRFWQTGGVEQHAQFANFMKNLSLMGAAIYIIHVGASAFSVDHRRLHHGPDEYMAPDIHGRHVHGRHVHARHAHT